MNNYDMSGNNHAPVLNSIGPKSVNENQLLEFTVTAGDPDGDHLTYSAANLPAGASFDPAAQRFQWTPGADDSGNYTVLFTVTDDGGPPMSDSENVTIAVSQSQEQKSGNISGGSGSGGGGCFIAGLLRKGGDFAQLFEHLSPSAPAEKAPTQSGTP